MIKYILSQVYDPLMADVIHKMTKLFQLPLKKQCKLKIAYHCTLISIKKVIKWNQ